MFDEEKRRKEIAEEHFKWYAKGGLEYSSKDFYDIIISQEKTMITQAKEEARKEFAEKIFEQYKIDYVSENEELTPVYFKKAIIDKLLKEYEE